MYRLALPRIVDAINNSYHRGIGMVPSQVRPEHQARLRNRFYAKVAREHKPNVPYFALEPLQLVRFKQTRGKFHVSYKDQYSKELFKVRRRMRTIPPTYELQTLKNEPLLGTWYEAELLPVTLRPAPIPTRGVP